MEFLRFGSSIPGSYWGCCAMDIIQNFKVDPDAEASIQIVGGDEGQPIVGDDGPIYAGPTYKDIFLQRLRFGTFGKDNMPNHGFLAILTKSQCSGEVGLKWLKILKEQGFEFVRAVDNSVYSGCGVINKPDTKYVAGYNPNYLFALFRNIGSGRLSDPYTPPQEWIDMESVVPEAWESVKDGSLLNSEAQKAQLSLYHALPENEFMSEKELEKDKVPITVAGQRSLNPQELKKTRDAKTKSAPAPFATS